MSKTKGTTDMTVGSPVKLILLFALPLIAGNMLQQLYNTVDSMVVGRFVGDAALAAVGTGFPIIFMISSLFMGCGMGATILIAQYYGAGDMEKVSKTANTISTALLIGSIPLAIAGIALAGPILRLVAVPADTLPLAQLYVSIIFAGMIGTLGYNLNSGILQGLGNSKTPLLFLAIACVMNIILDLLFVVVFRWGVAGVAIATVIAQMSSWMFGTIYLKKKYPHLDLHPLKFKFDKELFKKVVKLGIPMGIQQTLFSIGVLALQALINSFGTDFIAGFNGANKLDTFAFMPIQSFATAATTYVGQNMGAGKMDRVKHGTRSAIIMSCIFSVFAACLLIPAGPYLMRLFSDNPAVIEAGMAYLYRIMPFYCLLAMMFIFNSVIRGSGQMIIPMASTILSLWLVRVPAAYVLAHYFGPNNIFYCYAIGWIPGLLISGIYYFSGAWKKRRLV